MASSIISGGSGAASDITTMGGEGSSSRAGTAFGSLDIVEPTPGEGQKLYDVSTAGVNYADTHQQLPRN